MRIVSVVRAEAELGTTAESVRNARPVGVILPLEAREVRVVIPLPVQRQASLRVEHQALEYFDTGQPELIRLGSFARCFRTESRVGVRVVVHETESTNRLHARRVAKLHVLDVVVLGVSVRWREGSEELVYDHLGVAVAEATGDERLVAVGDGLEHIGLLQDGIVQRLVDVHAEVLPYVKLTLDALVERQGLACAHDDVMERALDRDRVQGTVDDSLDDLVVLCGQTAQLFDGGHFSRDFCRSFHDTICSSGPNLSLRTACYTHLKYKYTTPLSREC
jgi:hypothetical protein